jgi:hypothetical protein
MTTPRTPWLSSDTPRIRTTLVDLTSDSPTDRETLFSRVTTTLGIDVNVRRLYRALRWARDQGHVRLVVPEHWREVGVYVRVRGKAAQGTARSR